MGDSDRTGVVDLHSEDRVQKPTKKRAEPRQSPRAEKCETPSARGKRSRRKGAGHEREIAHAFQPVYPDARRGLGQARAGGEVPDVDGTPWWIEAKHRRAVNLRTAFAQAKTASETAFRKYGKRYAPHLIVVRQQGGTDLAVMDLDEFITLLTELESLRRAFDVLVEGGSDGLERTEGGARAA